MNSERLLRDIEQRLSHLAPAERAEVMDAVREELGRQRRRIGPPLTAETERERRVEAETLREALDAIHSPSLLEELSTAVLKQSLRLVAADFGALSLLESGDRLRVLAARSDETELPAPPLAYEDLHSTSALAQRLPLSLLDEGEAGLFPFGDGQRAWLVLPLFFEDAPVGVLYLGRRGTEAFGDDALRVAKALAFGTAAALFKARLLQQVRRFAALMEQVVEVAHRVFAGVPPAGVARTILEGALRIGDYPAGVLVVQTPRGPTIVAGVGDGFAETEGRLAPGDLAATSVRRLPASRVLEVGEALGGHWPAEQLLLLPLVTADGWMGALVLLDPNGESPDDPLVEAYASRAAGAYRHAMRTASPGSGS